MEGVNLRAGCRLVENTLAPGIAPAARPTFANSDRDLF
jgi:hypothetical protein